jgi:type IV pilus assembly protein PilB
MQDRIEPQHTPALADYLAHESLSQATGTLALTLQETTASYDESIIQHVDNLLAHALEKHASDIHIEPHETHCRVRYRQDGILYPVTDITAALATRLVTRLKVMAKLDIAERRLPQDGRFQLTHAANPIDIRINTCPTLFGEKVVLRLLNSQRLSLALDHLGLTDPQQRLFRHAIEAPQGLILVTGPTGSGKTVTLYSAIQHLNSTTKNISTVEDPVEIQLSGINQIQVNPKIGLSFSTLLRSLLRQDPDILMIGEIRDTETADIAIQAAQTGHLVLSTVHTNSAVDTLTRLQAMGIAVYPMINALTLIIAQRLVRKLCPRCKQPDHLTPESQHQNGITAAFKPQGCPHCLHGYQGRIGIYELLPVTTAIADAMLRGVSDAEIREQAKCEGFEELRQIAIQQVMQGVTSLAEINRVIPT